MMFVVRRLQKIGRKTRVSLFISFLDLQKAHDTAVRTLLCQVLTCILVPPPIIAIIRHCTMRLELVCDLITASARIGSK